MGRADPDENVDEDPDENVDEDPGVSEGVDVDLGAAGSSGFVGSVGVIVLGAGAALGIVRLVGGTPVEQGLEGALGAAAFGAVIAAPGVLALLSLRDRPPLLLPAAVLLVPVSFLSLAGVMLPLLVPAAMLFVAYGRRTARVPWRPGREIAATVSVLVLLAAAVVALFVHDDPRSFSTASGSGSTSDVIVLGESLLSLALTCAAVAAGWVLSAPDGRTGTADPRPTRTPAGP